MTKINANFLKLPGSYLFSEIARRVNALRRQIQIAVSSARYRGCNPAPGPFCDCRHARGCDEMGKKESFKGYGPEFDMISPPGYFGA